MINNIIMKDVASYDNNGVKISDLKKLNFFFGFNGSGKSTIAKYLYNISLTEDLRDSRYNNCSQQGYNAEDNKILVYNEDFIKRNFIQSKELDGIFSLDETNDTIDNEIAKKEKDKEKEKTYQEKREKLQRHICEVFVEKEKHLADMCFDERKRFDAFLKMPKLKFSGSKSNFLQKLRNDISKDYNSISITFDSLKSNYDKLYEQEIKKIEENIDDEIYDKILNIEKESNKLLSEVIVGNNDVDIAKMIEELNISSWVSKGVNLLDKTNGRCPFCQKNTIDNNLIDKFTKYFDKSYEEKRERIREQYESYKSGMEDLLKNLKNIVEVFNPETKVSSCISTVDKIYNENKRIFEEKISAPNEKKSIQSISSIFNALSEIKSKINENNVLFSELDEKRKEFENNIWIYMAKACESKILEFDRKNQQKDRIVQCIDSLIAMSKTKVSNINHIIDNLKSQTQDTQKAVSNINAILRNAGFLGFSIVEKTRTNDISKYQLVRQIDCDSEEISVFTTLSEGEKSFIAFLYFYQLCIGTNDKDDKRLKKKIIVIDDPVSSMDSQVLFVVSTLIQNLARYKWSKKGDDNDLRKEFLNETIDQIIVLTHNFYFYKEIILDRRPTNTDYNHYLVKKNENTVIENKQRIKVAVDDYTFMWQTLKEIKSTNQQNPKNNIVIANLMRRIIDSYVCFVGLGTDCWGAIECDELKNDTDKFYIKSSFLSEINKESHNVAALDTIYYQRISSIDTTLLFDVFESIFKNIGEEHYKLMMNK